MRAYKVLMVVLIVALLLGMSLGCGKKKVPDTGKAGPEGAEPKGGEMVPGGGGGPPMPGEARPGPEAGPPMPGGPGAGAGPPMPMMSGAADLVEEGMAEKRAGRFERAVLKFEAALLEDLDNEDAHWGLAWTLADQGKKSQAVAEFEKLLDLTQDPDRVSEAEAAIGRLR